MTEKSGKNYNEVYIISYNLYNKFSLKYIFTWWQIDGKLNVLDEFRAQREDLMKQFQVQEEAQKQQEIRHQETLHNIEKSFILKKLQWVVFIFSLFQFFTIYSPFKKYSFNAQNFIFQQKLSLHTFTVFKFFNLKINKKRLKI